MINKDKIIRNFLSLNNDKTKYTILRGISEGFNTFDLLEERFGFSKPLLAFHINGTSRKRVNGLIALGFVTKRGVEDRLDKFEYSMTSEGLYILDLLK